MKTMMISLVAGTLVLGVGPVHYAGGRNAVAPMPIEGKDRPILLARMVVEATPLTPATD
ncbi:hypothetical protein WG907_05000 [Sphingobium sp. AN558]|uniref:hypothetical protein n=1 Tax=Sphingobium sp. AN558 TaxID=3133442 RepID=UPI0030BC6674